MPDSPLHILIVDDDPLTRELLALTLAGPGRTIALAGSGEAALSLLAGTPHPDVILTDLQMPGLTGIPLAQALRPRTAATLLAMSGTEATSAERAAFDGFLYKPFTPEAFTALLARAPAAAPAPPPLDDSIFSKLAATLPAAQLQALYAMCLADAESRLTRLHAAADAQDATAFLREAHALKGSCGMLGASELHTLASQLETGALACTPLLADFPPALDRLRRMLAAHP